MAFAPVVVTAALAMMRRTLPLGPVATVLTVRALAAFFVLLRLAFGLRRLCIGQLGAVDVGPRQRCRSPFTPATMLPWSARIARTLACLKPAGTPDFDHFRLAGC